MWEIIPHKRRVGCGHRILNIKVIFENQREDSEYSFMQAGSCLVSKSQMPKNKIRKFQTTSSKKQDPKK